MKNNFRHHKHFREEKWLQNYLFPSVCLNCRKSYKKPQADTFRKCPECSGDLVPLSRKFSAPKSSDLKQWQKVALLIEHGFLFQPVYEQKEPACYYPVAYPEKASDVADFVNRYRSQAVAMRHFLDHIK